MRKINIGDKVFVKADAPVEYNRGKNIIFSHIICDVYRRKGDMYEIGIWNKKLLVPKEYLAHADDAEERKKIQEAEFERYPHLVPDIFKK